MQPVYSDCRNCGSCDHEGYDCPCACHAGLRHPVAARTRWSACPECDAMGPHEDNGLTRLSDLAFLCRSCGTQFDAIPL